MRVGYVLNNNIINIFSELKSFSIENNWFISSPFSPCTSKKTNSHTQMHPSVYLQAFEVSALISFKKKKTEVFRAAVVYDL